MIRLRRLHTIVEDLSHLSEEFQLLRKAFGVQETFDVPVESINYLHRVLVVHPKIRWGRYSASAATTPELQLNEAIALANTLPKLKVTSSVIVGTDYNTKRKMIWGSGRLFSLLEIKEKERATAIMINTDVLTPLQQKELFSFFRVPIFDRYNIVLNIFKYYAKTKEAMLQIELAEIPYIRQRLKSMDATHTDPCVFHINVVPSSINKYEVLRLREHSLRKRLKSVTNTKTNVRSISAAHSNACNIGIIGYTNAGKSSLIKVLTGKEVFIDKRMFATLDATTYFCRLPSGTPTFLIDTIGFISNLPVNLFASFQATLKNVIEADLLVHVYDASHPDYTAQKEIVYKTLKELNVRQELIDSMISVANKVDKVDRLTENSNSIHISCISGTGIPRLIFALDKAVATLKGKVFRQLRLRPGSLALSYLHEHSFLVNDPVASEDNSYIVCRVAMNNDEFALFQTLFPVAKKDP